MLLHKELVNPHLTLNDLFAAGKGTEEYFVIIQINHNICLQKPKHLIYKDILSKFLESAKLHPFLTINIHHKVFHLDFSALLSVCIFRGYIIPLVIVLLDFSTTEDYRYLTVNSSMVCDHKPWRLF